MTTQSTTLNTIKQHYYVGIVQNKLWLEAEAFNDNLSVDELLVLCSMWMLCFVGGKWGRGELGLETIITCQTIEIGLKNGMSKFEDFLPLTQTSPGAWRHPIQGHSH